MNKCNDRRSRTVDAAGHIFTVLRRIGLVAIGLIVQPLLLMDGLCFGTNPIKRKHGKKNKAEKFGVHWCTWST